MIKVPKNSAKGSLQAKRILLHRRLWCSRPWCSATTGAELARPSKVLAFVGFARGDDWSLTACSSVIPSGDGVLLDELGLALLCGSMAEDIRVQCAVLTQAVRQLDNGSQEEKSKRLWV